MNILFPSWPLYVFEDHPPLLRSVFTAPNYNSSCHFSPSPRASLKGSLHHGTLLRKMRTGWRTDMGISLRVSIDGVIVLWYTFIAHLLRLTTSLTRWEFTVQLLPSSCRKSWCHVHIKGRKNYLNTPTLSMCLALGLVLLVDLRLGQRG